jgi:hypothetical protein
MNKIKNKEGFPDMGEIRTIKVEPPIPEIDLKMVSRVVGGNKQWYPVDTPPSHSNMVVILIEGMNRPTHGYYLLKTKEWLIQEKVSGKPVFWSEYPIGFKIM